MRRSRKLPEGTHEGGGGVGVAGRAVGVSVAVGVGVSVGTGVSVGDGVSVGSGVSVGLGVFVGFGTRLSNGCTSGHGVCGIARLSPRSIAATAIFMAVAVAVVALMRHVIGA